MTQEVVWSPVLDGSTNAERFMALHGIASFDDLLQRSVEDPDWFWDAVVGYLGLPFVDPYDLVSDRSDGVPWTRWFTSGTTNIALACVDRWSDDPGTADHVAVVWEGEDGSTAEWTFAQLRRHTDAFALRLVDQGIGQGDVVAIFLPMLPETVAACMAVAKIGAVLLPIFSGFGPEAIAVRLADADAVALITAEFGYRRGQRIPMAETAAEAIAQIPHQPQLIVLAERGTGFADAESRPLVSRAVESEAPLLLAYTSGTTGKPKGSVHVQGGFMVKIAAEAAFQLDVQAGDRLFWFADFGWIMGPWVFVGGLAAGATICLYEGAPDWPDPGRLWEFLERHRVTILGISPTLIRSLMAHGDDFVRGHDLSALRILGSTGEPWNEDPWNWYFDVVGNRRCPVINMSGGTEVGACFLSLHPVQELTPMTLGGPALGMAVDVFDDAGNSLRDEVGELVCTEPWPGMTRGLWRDPDRYIATYWSRWPDVWLHGDWASVDDGRWFLHGRSDDTIKISGKRLGPAEVESALVAHPAVAEAAAIGVPDDLTGEQLWGFVVLAGDREPSPELAAELIAHVARRLGASFRPKAIRFTAALPKTRSSKVLRRAIRSTVLGTDPGDLSSLEDPASIDAIRAAVS